MVKTRTVALLFGLAIAAVLAGCGHKDQPTSAGSGTPTTPTSPTPPPPTSPEPPTTPTPQACAYAVAAEPDDFDRDGGNGTLTIATAAGCKWTIKSDATWAAVEGPTQGDGSATLKFSAEPNDGALDRRMTVAVADKSVAISQPGQGDCTYQVSPVTSTIPRAHWTAEIDVVTSRGCRWTAASDTSWIRLRGAGGSGSGRLTYEADFNPETGYVVTRTALVAIRWAAPTAGQNVRVAQWGACNLVAGPATGGLPAGATFTGDRTGGAITASADGGKFHLWILTDPFMGCAWTLESNDAWVSFGSPRVHQVMGGDGDVVFTLPPNPSSQPRRATLVMDGKPVTIVQQGR